MLGSLDCSVFAVKCQVAGRAVVGGNALFQKTAGVSGRQGGRIAAG